MDGIQPYAAPGHAPQPSAPIRHHPVGAPAANPAAAKAPSDYLRALRPRVWLVLPVAPPLSVAATVWAVRHPPIYQAKTQIKIEPLQHDHFVTSLLDRPVGSRDPEA